MFRGLCQRGTADTVLAHYEQRIQPKISLSRKVGNGGSSGGTGGRSPEHGRGLREILADGGTPWNHLDLGHLAHSYCRPQLHRWLDRGELIWSLDAEESAAGAGLSGPASIVTAQDAS